MNWHLAIEKNHEALRRILATLVALVGMTDGASVNPGVARKNTLPRHLHRYVLRLLRPAEAATRRLIIVAARGLVVKLPTVASAQAVAEEAAPQSQERLRHRHGDPARPAAGMGQGACAEALAQPVAAAARSAQAVRRPPALREAKRDAADQGVGRRSDRPAVPPAGAAAPAAAYPRRSARCGRIHRRLDAIGRALDDLPGQAQRMARWQARRDARWARERGDAEHAGQSLVEDAPSPSRPSGSPPLPHFMGARKSQAGAPALPPRFLAPTQWGRGGEPEGRDGEGVNWDEFGVTPEVLALCRARGHHAQQTSPPRRQNLAASTASPRYDPAVRLDGASGQPMKSTRS